MANKTPKRVRKIALTMVAIGIVIELIGILLNVNTVFLIIGTAILFAAMFYHLAKYRCPHCNAFLDRSTGEFCPYCGRNVNE